jgi:hypothetical protein
MTIIILFYLNIVQEPKIVINLFIFLNMNNEIVIFLHIEKWILYMYHINY